jgi:acyl-ACP thioesterase
MVELVPLPGGARVLTTGRSVRLGDVSPGGRVRLDAVVRYLQDVSDDDTRAVTAEFGGLDEGGWVVRRTALRVDRFPKYREQLSLRTWCSGLGGRWAERRVSMAGDQGRIEAAVLWVHVDPSSMRPMRLTDRFVAAYGPSTDGRTVSSRLVLDNPPPDVTGDPWPLRFTDFDALGHVNNAAAWEAVEEQLAARRHLRAPLEAIVEHRLPIERGDEVRQVVADAAGGGMALWLTLADGRVAVAGLVTPVAQTG